MSKKPAMNRNPRLEKSPTSVGGRSGSRLHHPSPPPLAIGNRIVLRELRLSDASEFLELVAASRSLHRPWVYPPEDQRNFKTWYESGRNERTLRTCICDKPTGTLMGNLNFNQITRGLFHSAYLGYWIGAPFAGSGVMTESLHSRLATRSAP